MTDIFNRFKPGVKRRTLLLFSALLWTLIGMLLLLKGGYRLSQMHRGQLLVVGVSFVIGSIKSRLVLDKAARRGIGRILNFADGTCLGAVYSIKTWILVLCMMGLGVILRTSPIPTGLLSTISLTIGWALLLSSRLAWQAWCQTSDLI
jgi:hypothetical protein